MTIAIDLLDRYAGLSALHLTYPSYRPMLMQASRDGPAVAIAAKADDVPVGLALLAPSARGDGYAVASLYVDPASRGQGIATELLREAERVASARGTNSLTIGFLRPSDISDAAEGVLRALDWPDPVAEKLITRCDRRMLEVDWLRQPPRLAQGAEIFRWSDLRDEERKALIASQADDPWIGPAVDPFAYDGMFAFNSVGMRYRGEVVGWVVTEQIGSDTLRYSCSYMKPRLQRLGLIVSLYHEAIHQHGRVAELPFANWAVPHAYPQMQQFVRRWMAPFALSVQDYVTSTKTLGSAAL